MYYSHSEIMIHSEIDSLRLSGLNSMTTTEQAPERTGLSKLLCENETEQASERTSLHG